MTTMIMTCENNGVHMAGKISQSICTFLTAKERLLESFHLLELAKEIHHDEKYTLIILKPFKVSDLTPRTCRPPVSTFNVWYDITSFRDTTGKHTGVGGEHIGGEGIGR